MLSNNIKKSDILYEKDVNSQFHGKFGTNFFIYKKDNEIGFVKTRPYIVNRLFPFVYGYTYKSSFKIDTVSGNTTSYIDGNEYNTSLVAASDNIQLSSTYIIITSGRPQSKHVYMGVKHHPNFYLNGHDLTPEFKIYLKDVFNDSYIYFFESEEVLDSDFVIN